MFMTAVSVSYILYAPKEGFGLDYTLSVTLGAGAGIACLLAFLYALPRLKKTSAK